MSDLAPAFRQQFFGTNGLPLAAGQIYTYIAGTTTPLATYTDETGLTANTNPIILDSTGTASIWINAGSYKFVLEDSLGNIIKTVDNISNPPSSTAGVSSFNTLLGAVILVAGTNVTLTTVGNTITIASSGGGGGGGTWGSITGTLSSQTDLQTALNLKANLAGPTFTGTVTGTFSGNVTGNVSGSSGSTTGNAATVTTNANLTGDATSVGNATTVVKINGTSLAGLSTGILKNTTTTGVPSIAIAADFPTLNQSTSGNAATVTTNANLTGPITSSGNATSVAAQTGTGTTFVMQATPTLTTPVIGAATGTSLSVSGQLTSTVTTGTAPLVVSSTTPVANLVAANINGTTNATLTTASALTSVGAIATGTWNATTVTTAHGGTGQTSVIIAPTASTYAGWDANKNFSTNALIPGFTTTATAAGTTTMTIASTGTNYWTGVTTQTIKLPTTSVAAGGQYYIQNLSTGVVTIQSSGANTIVTLSQNTGAFFTALVATPTTAANWDFEMTPSPVGSSSGNIWTSTGAASAPTWQAPSGTSPTGSYFNGFMPSTGAGWTTVSTSFATPTGGTNTLTTRKSSGLTVTAGGSNTPAITFTPASSSAVYLVSTSFLSSQASSASPAFTQLTDGTNVVSTSAAFVPGGNSAQVTLYGIYAPATASAITLTIQCATNNASNASGILNGNAGLNNAIEWQIVRTF